MLKIAVIAMSAVLVVGFAVIVARIGYLLSQGGASSPVASIAETIPLALPAGAAVRNMALSGQRLAVHYEAPSGAGIAILDLVTGRAITQVALSAGP
jgi:hypothetical protein